MAVRLRGPRPKAIVRVNRAVFIGSFVQEVLDGLTAGDHHPLDEIIETGIIKNQYIGQITVRYLIDAKDGGKRKIAEVSIEIDWERYKVNVAGLGEDLEIDPKKKKVEQISQILVVLLAYLDSYRKETRAKTEIILQWAPGIDVDEARRVMNTKQAERFAWLEGEIQDFRNIDSEELKKAARVAKTERDLEYEFIITPKLLDELRVVARVTDQRRVTRERKSSR